MTTRRLAKAAEAIRETVSTTILFELRDPRVKNVTVLSAEAAPDLRTAKVYVSVMGTPKQQSLCLHGLESARGYIQAKLADRLQTRYTPVLKFILDPGVKRSIEASRLLREIMPPHDDDSAAHEELADDWDDQSASGEFAETDAAGNEVPVDDSSPDDQEDERPPA
ncbi:MAG: ribosome-binding factor A [Planctomycetales bacterium 12-60-4]|nr:MAG: ribosome-binding factor A [Planctomycetales bacterium 12-60-4]